MNWFYELITNPFLLTALSSWAIAQVLKVFINAAVNQTWDLERLFGDGGMPSGHSATVASLAVFTASSVTMPWASAWKPESRLHF